MLNSQQASHRFTKTVAGSSVKAAETLLTRGQTLTVQQFVANAKDAKYPCCQATDPVLFAFHFPLVFLNSLFGSRAAGHVHMMLRSYKEGISCG